MGLVKPIPFPSENGLWMLFLPPPARERDEGFVLQLADGVAGS